MEIRDILDKYGIVGIVSKYNTIISDNKVSELNIKNINNALKMVGLDISLKDKKYSELSLSEQLKIDLATKLDKDIIIIGNMSNNLIYKDREYIKKLLIKLNNDYHKKIVVIDEDISVFIGLVKDICVMENKSIIYECNNFFDDNLYKYVKMPKIVEFIKYVNKDNKLLDENLDIYELLKDMYRRLS